MSRGTHLLAVTSRYPFGHQESYLDTELRELKRYFARITIVPVRSPDGIRRHAVPEGITVLDWPLFDVEVAVRAGAALFSSPIASCGALAQLFTSHDPGKAKNAAIAAKGLALGQWACEHYVSHVHAYWMSTPASVAYIAAAVAELPWSATAHRWDIYEKNAFDVKARAAAFVRTVSGRATRDLRARVPSLGSRIVEIRLGAQVPSLQSISWRSSRVVLRIVCPAALVPVKGQDDVLQAIALLRSRGITVHCIFAGGGPLRPMLEARARKLGLNGVVQFAGHVPQNVLHRWYSSGSVDAVVLANRADGEMVMEGLPSALIDAMAYGIPAVATDAGSVSELIDDTCGYLVHSSSPEALAAALARVHLDPQGAYDRATRAYHRVKVMHDVQLQMRKFVSAFRLSGGAV